MLPSFLHYHLNSYTNWFALRTYSNKKKLHNLLSVKAVIMVLSYNFEVLERDLPSNWWHLSFQYNCLTSILFTLSDVSIEWLKSIYFSSDCLVCTNYLITAQQDSHGLTAWILVICSSGQCWVSFLLIPPFQFVQTKLELRPGSHSTIGL